MIAFFISNKNIYASASPNRHEFFKDNDSLREITINNILITGNDRTKEKIILRELAFEKGLVYDSYTLGNNLNISKINLLKLPYMFLLRRCLYRIGRLGVFLGIFRRKVDLVGLVFFGIRSML